jgi:alpha-2-macroglobulin
MNRLQSLSRRPWLVALLLAACLGGVALIAAGALTLLRDREPEDGPGRNPELADSGQAEGIQIGGVSFATGSGGRLQIRLSKGQEQGDSYELLPVIGGDPLPPEALEQILDRLTPVGVDAEDRQDFQLPEELLPPPRPGQTIDEPFPLPPDLSPPAVPEGPLEVLRFSPEGEIPLAPFLSVTFNQPMVPLATVETLAASEVPVRLTPALPGIWRWLGTQTLTFEYQGETPVDRFPMATEFEAEVPAGTASETGGRLAQAVTWRFSTPPPSLISSYPSGSAVRLEPIFFIAFDQLVDSEAVLSTVSVTAGGRAVSVRLASQSDIDGDEVTARLVENAGDGRWLAFRAAEPLPADANIIVTIGPGTPSAEGPLRTEEAQSFSFSTYAPLRITEHRCSWYEDECPPLTPFYIQFNNPLDAEAFDPTLITIDPPLPGALVEMSGSSLQIRGNTQGRTTYRITVDGAIKDIFGQSLGRSETLRFRVGSAPDFLTGPDRPLVTVDPSADKPYFTVYTINYERLRVHVYAVEPADWPAYMEYRDNFFRQERPPAPPGQEVLNQTITVEGQADTLTEVPIDLSPALDGDHGHLIVIVEPTGGLFSGGRDRTIVHAWVQVTGIGLDAFADPTDLVAWATDLETGSPLPGVTMQLHPNGPSASTGADGIARLALPSGGTGLLIAGRDGDSAILPSTVYYWEGGGWSSSRQTDELRWFVFDDRQMYRPGEEVHLKGWLRLIGGGQTGDVGLPGGVESLNYTVTDPVGNELASGRAQISGLGGFDLAFELPTNSNLGFANVRLYTGRSLPGSDYYHGFQIQEFRRPEFEVTAKTETAGPYLVGDAATVSVAASYFAGGPLPNAETNWLVCSSPGSYSPPNWPDFTFGTWVPWWYYGPYYYEAGFYGEEVGIGRPGFPGGDETCESFAGATDAAGRHFLQIDFEALDSPKPFNVRAEGTVMDVNRQAWSASTSVLVHPADLYVGLRSERTFVQQGQPLEIAAIVTDIDGNAVAGRSIEMKAARLEWRFSGGQDEVDVQNCTVTSAAEPVICTFETAQGGTYEITAVVTDAQGRTNQSQLTRWVSGGKQKPQRNVTQEEVTLIPDKELYAPGDVAEILVQSPFGPAEGLLTVSRSGFLYDERFQAADGSAVLRVPIEDGHIPNLNIQIDLVGSAPRLDDAGEPLPDIPPRPAFATGSVTLNISTLSRSLDVQVAPAEARLSPGGQTTVDVAVTDGSGRPVAGAELALVVVDESVLVLTNYSLADPLAIFYTNRPGLVSSYYGRAYVILTNPEALAEQVANEAVTVVTEEVAAEAPTEGEMAFDAMATAPAPAAMPGAQRGADEDAAGQPITIRTDFNPLAAFVPAVQTDSDGRATVDIRLPDNLTRYRIMVVAVAGGSQFGTGESNLTARLPLMVRPSAPRFLNFGDRFELPVVLQNQTDQPLEVEVAIEATNLTLDGGQVLDENRQAIGLAVTVPANDRVEVRFPAAALSAGTVRFQVAAVSGSYADAAEASLPVYTPATTEAFATYGVVDQGAVAQTLAAPEGVFPQFGGLSFSTSSTALQGLTDAVLYLTSYPYECSEQLASRILAIAALKDVLSAFEAEGLPDPAALEAAVQRDIELLWSMQNGDGGWPIWRKGQDSIPFYSIHVAHALQRAEDKGFDVPQSAQDQALSYLRTIEDRYPDYYSQETRRSLSAYAVYVRHLMGDSDPAKADRLLGETSLDDTPLETLAWLWPVLDAGGFSAQVEAIGRHFNNRAVETANAANFTTSYGDQAYLMLHSDRRTDGLILDSLITVQPDSDLIPKVVNGLLAHRTRGRWNNTQENVFILLALDHYFNTFEAQTPEFVARAWLGDQYLAEHAYSGRSTERHETLVPMSFLVDGPAEQPIIVSKDGEGRLYYRLGLNYAPDDLNLEPLDMGFTVQRIYEAVDDPEDVYQDADGRWHIKAGARVRVTLTMVTSNRRYHVALVDPLPAGLEIINPALAVSGTIPQDPNASTYRYGWWWWGTWYEHQNMRDERAEAFASLLWDGVYEYTYVARATTPGTFVVPPAKAEEMYSPEVFGRSGSDWVIVE